MPIKKDWKTYYTLEEVDIRLKNSIRRSAKELVEELRDMKDKTNIFL